MQNPGEQERRDSLINLLFDLSAKQDILRERKIRSEYYLKLENIYYIPGSEECWRHYYSDILSTLTQIDSDDHIGSLDILAQNIQALKDGYKAVNKDGEKLKDISRSIIKLYDHTNLEIARINYTKSLNNNVKSDLAQAKLLTQNLKDQIDQAEQKNIENEKKLKTQTEKYNQEIKENQNKMQNEYISILGIFASIILAFTGGIAFSSSVLNNIAKASVYKLGFISFLIGLVFFNLIWVLLDFIRDINGKTIRKKWIFIVVNLVMISGMVCTCLAYRYRIFI